MQGSPARRLIKRVLAMITTAVLVGCGGTQGDSPLATVPIATAAGSAAPATASAAPFAGQSVVIGTGDGLPYAPLTLAERMKIFEKHAPGASFKFTRISGGAANREALMANQIQFGSGGIGPVLVAIAGGFDVGLVASLGISGDFLVLAKDPRIKTIKDIRPGDVIGGTTLDSALWQTVAKAAKRELGDAHALDKYLVTMDYPGSTAALINGQIVVAVSTVPYQYQLIEAGAHVILSANQTWGMGTPAVLMVTRKYGEANPKLVEAVYRGLDEAMAVLSNQPDVAAKVLAEASGGKVSAATYKDWITRPATKWTTLVDDFLAPDQLGPWMLETKQVKSLPASLKSISIGPLKEQVK